MKSTLGRDFINTVKVSNGPLLGLFGVAALIFGYFVVPDKTFSIDSKAVCLLFVCGYYACYFVFVLILMMLEYRKRAAFDQPEILSPFVNQNIVHLLLEPSDLFVLDGYVSILQKDNLGLELSIAIGKVSNIQLDGKIQVAIEFPFDPADPIWEKLKKKEQGATQNLIVKAHVPASVLVGRI
jgi:hypothetical protein